MSDLPIRDSEDAQVAATRRRRVIWYLIVGASLLVFSAWARGAQWHSSETFHTVLEISAALLALCVGVSTLVRFYSHEKRNAILFLGVGFIGTGLLDGYHAAVTSAYFKAFMPSDLPSLIPWSWMASRQFLSVMLLLSWLGWRREQRMGVLGRVPEPWVYGIATVLIGASFLFFAFVPLPAAYYPDLFFHRPEEFVPGLVFAVALWGYLTKGRWASDGLEHWLVLSLITALVSQVVMMPFSSELYDVEFDAAHLLKNVSYVFVLVGLAVSIFDALRVAEEGRVRLRVLVDYAPEGIITIDDTGALLSLNPAAEQMFQVSEDVIIGSNVRLLMPDPDRSEHDDYLARYLRTGDANVIGVGRTAKGIRADGTIFSVDITVSEISLFDGPRRFVGLLRDVTARVEAEAILKERTRELAVANEELEAFIHSVSHDLRGPLRTMTGFAYALRTSYREDLTDEALDYVDRIFTASGRMSDLVDGLLSLSWASRGDMLVEPVDLSELARSVISELTDSDLDTVVRVRVEEGLSADGDPRMLRVLFKNLLGNAWKFTLGVAGPEVEIGVERDGGPDVFHVKDNGVGFDMARVDEIFKPFRRLHEERDFEGTGVGLATVARIVERHGGHVWAESAVGDGTSIYFTLEEEET